MNKLDYKVSKEADVNWNKVNVYMDLQHLVILQILIVK